MPFLLALAPAFEAIGLASTTATPLGLSIQGRVFGLGERSTHIMSPDTDGVLKDMGCVWYERVDESELEQMRNLPILAPDLKTQIGMVSRAWMENEALLFEGTIRDSEAARFSLTTQKCGACLEYRNLKQDGVTKEYSGKLVALRICLQGQSGFPSSYVKFTDPAIRLEDTGRPFAVPMEWSLGYGW
jgi:hypothetical protein